MQSLARPLALVGAVLLGVFLPIGLALVFFIGTDQSCQASTSAAPAAGAAVSSGPVTPGARPPYSQAQMEAAVRQYDPAQAHILGAIAMAESSGYAFPATNPTGHYHGPWQFQEASNSTLDFHRLDTDLNYSAKAAADLAKTGITYGKWETYGPTGNGPYVKFMGGAPSTTASGHAAASAVGPAPATQVACTTNVAALSGGGTASADGWTFPLRTTQAVIRRGSQDYAGGWATWCFTDLSNCHHDYNAADLMVPTGTLVLAPVAGTAVTVHVGLGPACSGPPGTPAALKNRGDTISFTGADGQAYFLGHMATDSLVSHIHPGDKFAAGAELGVVGTVGNAQCTVPHLHIQQNPPGDFGGQTGGSRNIQPVLVKLFGMLPK